MSALALVIPASEEVLRELPMPPEAYGLLTLGAFFALLGVLWAFRNTAQKIRQPGGHGSHGASAAGHGAHSGEGHGGHH